MLYKPFVRLVSAEDIQKLHRKLLHGSILEVGVYPKTTFHPGSRYAVRTVIMLCLMEKFFIHGSFFIQSACEHCSGVLCPFKEKLLYEPLFFHKVCLCFFQADYCCTIPAIQQLLSGCCFFIRPFSRLIVKKGGHCNNMAVVAVAKPLISHTPKLL